jgi:nucleoside-diphosphate-sugar epimerase
MTILITGATGFVISNLTRHLAELGQDVVAADLNPPDDALRDFLSGLPGQVSFRQVDVADAEAVHGLVRELRPARAVHGAAITAIPPEVERARFVRTAEVNVMGTLHVLDALREVGSGRIVVVSSGSVYGPRPDSAPVSEDDPGNPRALYPITKWAAESLARRFAEVNDLDLGVVRLASPFGPFERDTGSRPLLSAIRTWALAGLRGEPIRVSGPPDAPRDVVYAADVASGIAAVLLADRLPHRVYNVGWGRAATSDEILAGLAKLIPNLTVERLPREASPWSGGPNGTRGPLRNDRLRQDLGWAPRFDLDSGLAAYVDWLARHSDDEAHADRSYP